MLFLDLLQGTGEVMEETTDGLNRRIYKVAIASSKITSQQGRIVMYEARMALPEMPFFSSIFYGMSYRAQYQTVSGRLYMVDERKFFFLKMESSHKHASLQLGHTSQKEFGKPMVEFYKVHLVTLGTEIAAELDDACEHRSVVEHGCCCFDDDMKYVYGSHVCVYGMSFVLFDFAQSVV